MLFSKRKRLMAKLKYSFHPFCNCMQLFTHLTLVFSFLFEIFQLIKILNCQTNHINSLLLQAKLFRNQQRISGAMETLSKNTMRGFSHSARLKRIYESRKVSRKQEYKRRPEGAGGPQDVGQLNYYVLG